MPIYPKKSGKYNISGIVYNPVTNSAGQEVFRGYGSDTSNRSDDIIYFYSRPLERVVSFKGFLESLKVNLTRQTEESSDADKIENILIAFNGEANIDFTINIPAHSTNEAKNNVAKIEELQRLIAPLDPTTIGGSPAFYSFEGDTTYQVFNIFFKNLISSGFPYDGYPKPFESSLTNSQLLQKGFPCAIENINYEPDFDAGFFEIDNLNLPKNIKLTINAILEVGEIPDSIDNNTVNVYRPIEGFLDTGHYGERDYGGFPFGVRAVSGGSIRENAVIESLPYVSSTVTTKTMNDNMTRGKSDGLFISFPIRQNTETDVVEGGNRKRYVYFDPFLKSFSRDHAVHLFYAETKTISVGKSLHATVPSTFKNLKYTVAIDIPARNLNESIKNCAKIQYLTRMFYKASYSDPLKAALDRINSFSNTIAEDDEFVGPVATPGSPVSDFIKKNGRFVKVYLPGYIEKPNASRKPPTDFSGKYSNSLDLAIMDLNFDIDMDMGFFERNGNLYPKAITLNLTMVSTDGQLIKNYYMEDQTASNEIDIYEIEKAASGVAQGFEHLFPFNRKTVNF